MASSSGDIVPVAVVGLKELVYPRSPPVTAVATELATVVC